MRSPARNYQLESLTSQQPTLIRPPYGDGADRVSAVAERLGYRATVLWSIQTDDWENPQPSADTIAARVLENIRPGAIVLLHDGCAPEQDGQSRMETVEAVQGLIPALRDVGFELTTVSRLLDSAPSA